MIIKSVWLICHCRLRTPCHQVDVLDKLQFTGTFAAFVEQCQGPSNGQYYKQSRHMLEGYQILNEQIASLLPAYFETLPASPLQLEELHAASAPAAFYMQVSVSL